MNCRATNYFVRSLINHTQHNERRSMDTATDLDKLIERRSNHEPDPDEREELWKTSVRKFHEKNQRANRAAWYGFHLDQAERIERTAAELVAHHRQLAESLLGEAT